MGSSPKPPPPPAPPAPPPPPTPVARQPIAKAARPTRKLTTGTLFGMGSVLPRRNRNQTKKTQGRSPLGGGGNLYG
jgi:hypothetical protein